MFDFGLGGLFTGPIEAVNKVADEKLKQSVEKVAISFGYSQYITFTYCLGVALEKKRLIGFLSPVFKMMAMSAWKLIYEQDQQKFIITSIPQEMIQNKELQDAIWFGELKLK